MFAPFLVQIHHIRCISFSFLLSRSACYTSVFCPFHQVSSWPSSYVRVLSIVAMRLCLIAIRCYALRSRSLSFSLSLALALFLNAFKCLRCNIGCSAKPLSHRPIPKMTTISQMKFYTTFDDVFVFYEIRISFFLFTLKFCFIVCLFWKLCSSKKYENEEKFANIIRFVIIWFENGLI